MNSLGLPGDILAQISTFSPWTLLLTKVTLLLAVVWLIHFSLVRANPRWRILLWRGAMMNPENRWLECASQIDAPDELPGLQNANFEFWKLQPTP